MAFAGMVHKGLRKELPEDVWAEVEKVLKEIASSEEPSRHRKVVPLEGCNVLNSHRARIGRWRVTFTIFDERKQVVFAVGFMERNQTDYKHAVAVHEKRIKEYQ